ncbi:MAG: hypothetical protein EA338_07360 [Roseinatronobacter sp.]|nr:MAG: hypothetical protein EA338_07360 [Roseinatronobacter sp.]
MYFSKKPENRPLTLAAVFALAFAPVSASADSEMTDFAFEMVDPGFCAAPPPDMSDDQVRNSAAERPDDFPVQGGIEEPISAEVQGDAFFARGSGRNAIASTIYAGIMPDTGAVSFLCLALVPVNEMNLTDGQADLRGPDAEPEDGDYYMVLGRILSRDSHGAEQVLADIETANGTLDFSADRGDEIAGRLALTGQMTDGSALDLSFDITMIEDEYVRFVDLSGD